MVSDDTEHAVLVGQAILRSQGDPDKFQRALAWGLRGWLAGLPAGIGLATLRSCLKLSVGVSPQRSGVQSAGNGAAMRAPLIGAVFDDDIETLLAFCDRSSVVTHRDPRAIIGARITALAARHATLRSDAQAFFEEALVLADGNKDWLDAMRKMAVTFENGASVDAFAVDLGAESRVSGYVMQSVPVALYAWLAHRPNIFGAIESCIRLGGDTDTTAAIAGALCGAEAGASALPNERLAGLWEWPRSVVWMRTLADRLATNGPPLPVAWPLIPARNFIFTSTVLYHGFRRLF